MKRYNYAKIPAGAAMELGLEKIRRQTVSGEYIINESDLLTYGDVVDSFPDKVERLGGTPLTALEAKVELQKTE